MISTQTIRSVAALALVAFLAACGGGGDDGGSQAPIVSETSTYSAPDNPNGFRNDWLVTHQSAPSKTGVTGDYRYQVCARGVWRQTLRADATLRLTLSLVGQPVKVVNNFPGKAGTENRIEFSGCAESFGKATQATFPRASATFQVQAMDNRGAFPVDGYDVTVEWTLTMLP